MKQKRVSIKEMIYSNKGAHHTIISFKDHLDGFRTKGKDYEDMLDYMVSHYDYYDDDEPLGRPNDVQKALGYSYSKYVRILKLLFKDVQDYLSGFEDYWDADQNGIKVTGINVTYYLKYLGDFTPIIVRGQTRVPNIGETITIENLRYISGGSTFLVNHISHRLENTTQFIAVYCSSNFEKGYHEWSKDLDRRW